MPAFATICTGNIRYSKKTQIFTHHINASQGINNMGHHILDCAFIRYIGADNARFTANGADFLGQRLELVCLHSKVNKPNVKPIRSQTQSNGLSNSLSSAGNNSNPLEDMFVQDLEDVVKNNAYSLQIVS